MKALNGLALTVGIVLLLVDVGCSSSRCLLCIAPQGDFNPKSEVELLAKLNSQLPFTIAPRDFFSKQKSSRLVGWAIVQSDEEKELVKSSLKGSAILKVLQVEALTPELEAMLRKAKP